MTTRDIKRPFTARARSWPHRTDCILVGGAYAVLEGGLSGQFTESLASWSPVVLFRTSSARAGRSP